MLWLYERRMLRCMYVWLATVLQTGKCPSLAWLYPGVRRITRIVVILVMHYLWFVLHGVGRCVRILLMHMIEEACWAIG